MEPITKICTRCKEKRPKTKDYFYNRKNSLDGLNTICIPCLATSKKRGLQHWLHNKLLCVKCLEYKVIEDFDNRQKYYHRAGKEGRCKECKEEQRQRRRLQNRGDQGLERLLTERFCGIKDRAKKHKLEINLTKQDLKDLWVIQNGLCAISSLPMTTKVFMGRIPTNISVDRIKPTYGYIKGNVQLVCMAVNQMKSDLTQEELLNFCYKIIETHEGEVSSL